MEDTQVIDWDAEEEEETERPSDSLGYSLEPIGRLHVFGGTHGPQKDFPLYIGKNMVGRSPDCSVVLPFPSVSKLHAVIEISAWNKAAVLQDCGSLNGTRIMRPPKILSPGMSHRLRNQELILFADFPCQYHRLGIPLPLASRGPGPLTIEETPRVQGGAHPSRLLLAEDSEEEEDFLSARCVIDEPRTTSSPITTVVPESDEEELSPVPGVADPSFVAFDVGSDTDEEEDRPPEAGEASSTARKGAAAEAQKYKDTKVKTDAGNGVAPLGERSHLPGEDSDTDMDEEHQPPGRPARVCLERAQPSGFMDSDTDVEEEGFPVTSAVVPVKKRQALHGVRGKRSPGASGLLERPAGKEGKIPLTAPLGRSYASVVINSDTDDEEEVSAALALAHLKESGAVLWSRDKAVEKDRAQPRTTAGRDSDTDMEKEALQGKKRETTPNGPTHKDGALVLTHSEKSQPLLEDSDSGEEADVSSSGIQLEGSQASAIQDNVDMEEDIPPGPAVPQMHGKQKNQRDPEDLCLEATQCFVKESQSPETVQDLEDEPTQAFILTLSQEPGPSHRILQTPGHLNCKAPPVEKASRGDPESSNPCLLNTVPTASAPPQDPLISQSQKHSAPHPLVSSLSPSKPPIPLPHSGSLEGPKSIPSSKPNTKSRRCSRAVPTTAKPQTTFPADLPATPKPTSQATWGKTNRSSIRTSEPPVTPRPVSRVTRGRTSRSSIKITEPGVPTGPELQTTSSDQPATPKSVSRVTRGRTSRSSVKTPEPGVPTGPELQPISSDQPATPKSVSRVTRGRTSRSTVRTSEPVVPAGPEVHPDMPKPVPQATQGRISRSSVKTPAPVIPTDLEVQPVSSDQSATPKPVSRVTRGRTSRSSIKPPGPVVPTGSEIQPAMSKSVSQATRGRTSKPSVRTPEGVTPTPEPQPPPSIEQPATPKSVSPVTRGRTNRSSVKIPEPVSRATRNRTCKSSSETPESGGRTAPDLEPPVSTDQSVIPETIDQSKALRSSTLSAAPIPIIPELKPSGATAQPAPREPSNSRRQRAAGKQGSHIVPIGHRPYSAPAEPESQSSTNQRPGALRVVASLGTIPEPAFPQLSEVPTPTHAPLVQNVEAAGRSGLTLEPKLEAPQTRKRSSTVMDTSLPKRPQRGISQKSVLPNEEDIAKRPVKQESQDVVDPEPAKRKRDQSEEEESKGNLSRILRRNNANQDPVMPTPKVLFTGIQDTRGEQAVLALGGSLATSINEASHLVTDRVRRTVKFLCALGKGIPILTLEWLYQSNAAGCFLPPNEYLVKDPEQEKNFSFSLRNALRRAGERKLLEGYEIHVTPGVQPPPPQMGEIIKCCGGKVLPSMPRSYKPHRVVITCPQDIPCCSIPSRLGLPLVSPEFLLTGVLKQEATPEAFLLSSLPKSSA